MKYFKFLLIGLIFGCLLGLFSYDRWLCSDDVITLYDSTIVEIPVNVPVPYEVIEYVNTHTTDTIYRVDTIEVINLVDTAAILTDYVRLRRYKDTIRDSDMVAYLDESVQFNRLTGREFSYQILRPTEVHTEKHNSLYVGGYVYNTGLTVNMSYFRNKWGVSVGYDPMNTRVFIGANYKLITF